MAITETIVAPIWPQTADGKTVFNQKSDALAPQLIDIQDQMNTYATQANALATEVNGYQVTASSAAVAAANAQTAAEGFRDEAEGFKDDAEGFKDDAEGFKDDAQVAAINAANDVVDIINQTALSTANFVGAWSEQTGALSIPASVSEGSDVYLLLEDLADVTLWQPSLNPDKWLKLNTGIVIIDTPIVTGITDDTIEFSSYATLNDFYGAHERTRVQISATNDFSGALLIDENIDATETYSYVTVDPVTFWVRVSYGSNAFFSNWSNAVELTNAGFQGALGIDLIEAGASNDQFQAITIDASNNIYVAGYTGSVGEGGIDGWIVKFDSSLNKLAEYTLGGTSNDQFYAITIDASNNIYVAGETASVGEGNYDGWIVKFDSSLNKLAEYTLGGTSNDQFQAITIDASNNIYVAGYTGSVGEGGIDGWIVKFDSSLNKLAEYTLGGIKIDRFQAITIDASNNIYVAGDTSSVGEGGSDGWIVKFDSSLNKLAEYTLGGTSNDRFQAITIDASNNIYVAGYTGSVGEGGSDGWIVKFDSSLNKLAEYTLGGTGSDQFQAITIDASNNIYVAGDTVSVGAGNYDGWIVKFDSSLNKLAEYTLGGTGSDQFQAITISESGAIVFAGKFSDGVSSNGVVSRVDSDFTITEGAIANLPSYTVEVQNQTYTSQDQTYTSQDQTYTSQNQTYTSQNQTYTAQTSTVTYSDL